MGSLSNLYISQSYQSLIHVGTNNTASTSFNVLQDGLGNSLGISVNTLGEISASGNIYGLNITGSSVDTGSLVTTSSFNSYTSSTNARLTSIEATTASLNNSISALNTFSASQITKDSTIASVTSSLNTFTSSANSRLNNLESTTASINTSLSALNTFSASQITKDATLANVTSSLNTATSSLFTSASRAITTASVNLNTITFTKGDGTTFPIIVNTGSAAAPTFPFTGSAQITGSLGVIGPISTTGSSATNSTLVTLNDSVYPIRIVGRGSMTDGLFISGSTLSADPAAQIKIIDSSRARIVMANSTTANDRTHFYIQSNGISRAGINGYTGVTLGYTDANVTNVNAIYISASAAGANDRNFIGFNASPSSYVGNYNYVFEAANAAQGGARTFIKGHLFVSQSFTASLQDGYAWVGNSTGYGVPTATSSFAGTPTDITSLNAFTSSQLTINSAIGASTSSLNTFSASTLTRLTNIESTTASLNTSVAALNTFSASQITKDATLANVTASLNNFTSSQTLLNGTFATTGSNTFVGNQNIIGDITASNLTVGVINATTIYTTYETSSIIYSSGSNQFGDELTDVQTLSGSVKVQGSLTVNGTPVQTSSVDISALNQATASLQAFTASAQISINALNSNSESVNTSITNINSFTASAQSQLTSLSNATSSYVTETESGSFLITASVNLNTITFSKGDNTTFAITVNTGSATSTDISALNSFTASQLTINSGYNTFTQSAQSQLTALTNATSSYAISSSVAAVDAAQQSQIDNLIAWTSSVVPTNISALNAFTASQLDINSGYNTFTASANTSITNLNSFTASNGTAALNSYTQSNDTKWSNLGGQTGSYVTSAITASSLVTASFAGNTLTFTKGDASTFGIVIPDNSGSAGTTIFEVVYTGESITKGDPLYISGSQGANPIVYKADAAFAAKMPVTFVSNETIGAANTTNAIVLGLIEGIDLTGYTAGQSIYVAEGGGWSTSLPSGSNSVTQLLGVVTKGGSGGKGLVLNPGPAQLPGLDTGKMWVGNGNNQPIEITTASFASSASFNSYTSSTDSRLTNIEATTASLNTSVSNLNTFSASALSSISQLNASSASQQVSIDNLNITTASLLIETQNLELFSASALISLTNLNSATASLFTSASLSLTTASFAGNTLTFRKGDGTTFGVVIPDVSGSTINTGSFATTGSNAFFGNNTFSGSLAFTGSNINVLSSSFSGTVVTNLTDTYTDVPAVQKIVTLSSASYAALASGSLADSNTLYIVSGSTSGSGGGGAAFPYTGNAVISGSLQVTGSFRGFVSALTVASSTASINMVNGNFFTLNLPTSSTTHITVTNITPGQTINLQVSQSLANTGSIAFAPNIKFAGGFDYTATAITGALDLVSFIAFDANQILATSVKNLL